MVRQPLLHDQLVALAAPTQAWSGADGQIRAGRADLNGVFHADVRVLSEALLTVDGVVPEGIAGANAGSGCVRLVALARDLDGPGADPTTRIDVERTVTPGRMRERLTLSSATSVGAVEATVRIRLGADLLPMDRVKAGEAATPVVPTRMADGLRWVGSEAAAGGVEVQVRAPGARIDLDEPTAPTLVWTVRAEPDRPAELTWQIDCVDPTGAVRAAPGARRGGRPWSTPSVQAWDRRLPVLLERSLDDLGGLLMSTVRTPDEAFVAAGAPWFFTLFGRDSIWAARMMLPLGTELAGGTLRTLAAAQGSVVDRTTGEEPGKILHELRRAPIGSGTAGMLPPLYYGSIDATPLWVCLLADAWRWGLPEAEVAALLPAAERALDWMVTYGDADGDGFLEYDSSGGGLANQGWKDSGDSVRWRDGALATPAIALVEVQGYAHEAALAGADLLCAFGRPGAHRWRDWAGRLATRFRSAYWVADADGPYPAIALDAGKRPVDSVASNMAHLLGTGLLDPGEERAVAARVAGPALDSGYGLRTLAAGSGGYWPLSYHGGAVWPHDTAIAIRGLARAGYGEVAARLGDGLVRAAPDFGFRLPELFSGDGPSEVSRPVPYPASCRPQAWSAAAAMAIVTARLGLSVDVPNGWIRVSPASTDALSVSGLRVGGQHLAVAVDAQAGVTVEAPSGFRVDAPAVAGLATRKPAGVGNERVR
ncbi:amylo-alpha-1,6-glucosidase [Occultella glacieicola]|uniref:Amylo-alpha-1,6-glucosidase n=1 Tax=Occultella glacieicola TaxID=2518684 RepID=A0ABY2DXP1_9MICO|nr:glycogen debranching N-terminal domain-containing protein [Occultella glacieicola]TDE88913.1 amylo-alpha-1,6-glucosidase [Occultella glacieicola]